jgi:DNA polymerase-3 subunit gamma/tau
MAYTVLARKYRSQRFDEVIGQGPISATLKNAIKTGRVAHAFLFTGTRGVGKTTMARILAKSLNCHSFDEPTTEPCCKCESCIAVNAGDDIDVIEIDGASNNGVEEVRRLRENAIYRPGRSRFKIYIIDEVHMLTTNAFNALLKTLEEPPDHVKFIFATTEPNKVLATIQSRCQRFDFNNISPALIAGQFKKILEAEKITYEADLLPALAKMARGSMRDGLSLLDRLISTGIEPLSVKLLEEFLGCADSEKMYNLIAKIGDGDAGGTLAAIEDLVGGGLSEVQIVDSLVDYMRDLMVLKSTSAGSELVIMTEQQRIRASELAEEFDIAGLVYSIMTLEKLRWAIKNSETARALLDACVLRFALSEHFLNVDELLSQISGGSAGGAVKKKRVIDQTAKINTETESKNSGADEQCGSVVFGSLESVKENWQQILEVITEQIGAGAAGLLASGRPSRLEGGVLTVAFPADGQIHKKMCEENGRAGQIESLLSKSFGVSLKLKFELAAGHGGSQSDGPEKSQNIAERKNELLNDPAVQMVLIGLDATVTGIE